MIAEDVSVLIQMLNLHLAEICSLECLFQELLGWESYFCDQVLAKELKSFCVQGFIIITHMFSQN